MAMKEDVEMWESAVESFLCVGAQPGCYTVALQHADLCIVREWKQDKVMNVMSRSDCGRLCHPPDYTESIQIGVWAG